MDEREHESVSLVAAILERAILDMEENTICPYGFGSHRVRDCASPVVLAIWEYARDNDGLTAIEAANEIVESLYAR